MLARVRRSMEGGGQRSWRSLVAPATGALAVAFASLLIASAVSPDLMATTDVGRLAAKRAAVYDAYDAMVPGAAGVLVLGSSILSEAVSSGCLTASLGIEAYNLASGGDRPSRRVSEVPLILAARPRHVVLEGSPVMVSEGPRAARVIEQAARYATSGALEVAVQDPWVGEVWAEEGIEQPRLSQGGWGELTVTRSAARAQLEVWATSAMRGAEPDAPPVPSQDRLPDCDERRSEGPGEAPRAEPQGLRVSLEGREGRILVRIGDRLSDASAVWVLVLGIAPRAQHALADDVTAELDRRLVELEAQGARMIDLRGKLADEDFADAWHVSPVGREKVTQLVSLTLAGGG